MFKTAIAIAVLTISLGQAYADDHDHEHDDEEHVHDEVMHNAVLHGSQCYRHCSDQLRQNTIATIEGNHRILDLSLKMLEVGSPEVIVAGIIGENVCLHAVANVLTLENCYATCRDLETVHPHIHLEGKDRFVAWFESEREPLVRVGLIDENFQVAAGADFANACAAYNSETESSSAVPNREGLQSLSPMHLLPTSP